MVEELKNFLFPKEVIEGFVGLESYVFTEVDIVEHGMFKLYQSTMTGIVNG